MSEESFTLPSNESLQLETSSQASQGSSGGDDFIRHEGVNCSYVTASGKKCKIQTVHRDTGACKTHHKTIMNARAKAIAKPNVKAKVSEATDVQDLIDVFKSKVGGGVLGVRNQVIVESNDNSDSDDEYEAEVYAEKLREHREEHIPVSSAKVFALKQPVPTDAAGTPLPPKEPVAKPVKKQTKTIVPKHLDIQYPEYIGKIPVVKAPKPSLKSRIDDLIISGDNDDSLSEVSDVSEIGLPLDEEEFIRAKQIHACGLLKDLFIEGGLGTLSDMVPRYRGIDELYRHHPVFDGLWPRFVSEISDECGYDMTQIKATHLMLATFARDLALYRAPPL